MTRKMLLKYLRRFLRMTRRSGQMRPDHPARLSTPSTTNVAVPPPEPAPKKTASLNGTLEQFSIGTLLTMMEMEEKEGCLIIKNENAEVTIKLFLREGRVVRAYCDANPFLGNEQVIYWALEWSQGTFTFTTDPINLEDEVQSSTRYLLLEAARRTDESRHDS